MRRHLTWTASGLALALAICLLTASDMQSAAADQDAKAAILQLIDGKGDPEALAKKGELGDFMHLFKLRNKKGLGVGSKPGAITPDGIEAKLMGLGKRADRTDVSKNGPAYEQMAQVMVAVAKVTDAFTPKEKKAGKDPKDWKKFVDDMKSGATELGQAAKNGDATKVKVAANKTVGACNECHSMFRD